MVARARRLLQRRRQAEVVLHAGSLPRDTCWLFRNRGNGTFEDVTASSGIFDSSSKALGVALLDDDQDGWPDLVVANDTQPNKLYRNLRNGTFKEMAVQAGVALSADGRARAGMGIDAADFENSGRMGIAVTNFDNEMAGLYRPARPGLYEDIAVTAGVGAATRNRLGFGCLFADIDLDGALDLVIANGHIDETSRSRGVGHAQPPLLLMNLGRWPLPGRRRRGRRRLRHAARRPRPGVRRLRP